MCVDSCEKERCTLLLKSISQWFKLLAVLKQHLKKNNLKSNLKRSLHITGESKHFVWTHWHIRILFCLVFYCIFCYSFPMDCSCEKMESEEFLLSQNLPSCSNHQSSRRPEIPADQASYQLPPRPIQFSPSILFLSCTLLFPSWKLPGSISCYIFSSFLFFFFTRWCLWFWSFLSYLSQTKQNRQLVVSLSQLCNEA